MLISFLQGCATTLSLNPIAIEGQKEIYQEGTKTLISPKKSLVAIRPSTNTYQSVQRPVLVVSVLNGTDKPFNFSTEDIEVYVDNNPLKVFTYDELVAEVEKQRAFAAFAVALGGVAQSINAANSGYTYHSGTYNSSYYSNYGYSGYGYGSYSGYSYNPSAALQAQSTANTQMLTNMAVIKSQTNQALNEIGSTILKKSTVFPQKIHGGYIKLDKIPVTKEINNISVKINAGGEIHDFNFQLMQVSPGNKYNNSSKINVSAKKDFEQEAYKPAIETKDIGQAKHLANQTDRLKSFLFCYRQTYENKDLDRFAAFFTPDATENNRAFHELLPKYRENLEKIESFSYQIDLVSYSFETTTGDIQIKGKFFTRFLYEGTLKENSGNITMELVENGDSYLIKRLNYDSQSEKRVEKQPQWGPWIKVKDDRCNQEVAMKLKNLQNPINKSRLTLRPRIKNQRKLIPFPVNYLNLLNMCEWPQSDVYRRLEKQYKTLPVKEPNK